LSKTGKLQHGRLRDLSGLVGKQHGYAFKHVCSDGRHYFGRFLPLDASLADADDFRQSNLLQARPAKGAPLSGSAPVIDPSIRRVGVEFKRAYGLPGGLSARDLRKLNTKNDASKRPLRNSRRKRRVEPLLRMPESRSMISFVATTRNIQKRNGTGVCLVAPVRKSKVHC
jgi:hypothetical protein